MTSATVDIGFMCFCKPTSCHIMKLNKLLMGFVLQDELSPLHKASQEGHLDVVKTLLEAGAYINQADKVSSTHTCTCTYMFMT